MANATGGPGGAGGFLAGAGSKSNDYGLGTQGNLFNCQRICLSNPHAQRILLKFVPGLLGLEMSSCESFCAMMWWNYDCRYDPF